MKRWALVALLQACSVQANNDIDELFSLSIDDLLDIEITGATLSPRSLITVPSAVTAFTHTELSSFGFDNISELTSIVPGFQSYRIAQTSNLTPFSSRGRQSSSGSPEILID